MNQILAFAVGCTVAVASAAAAAQDFTAGKTPAQLFSSDCAECHRSPSGLASNRDVRMLASFLREHYTTKSETAGALAAYVSGFGGVGAAVVRNRSSGGAAPANTAGERPQADRRRRSDDEAAASREDVRTNARPVEESAGRRRRTTNLADDGEKRLVHSGDDVPRPPGNIAAPAPLKLNDPAEDSTAPDATTPINNGGRRSQADRRNRSDNDVAVTGEEARANARSAEDPAGRRRRAANRSGDGEKRRTRNDSDVRRPPGSVVATPAPSKSNVSARDSASRDAADPISRLRSYLSSGLGFESTIAEAAKTGAKARKRRNHVDNIEPPTPDVQPTAKTATEGPTTAPPSATSDATRPEAPSEGNASSASVSTVPPAVAPPRSEQ